MTDSSVAQAVEVAKAAIGADNGVWIAHGDTVAKFIDTVAKKIDELRNLPNQR